MEFHKVFFFLVILVTFIGYFGTLPVKAQGRSIYAPLRIFPYFKNLNYELDIGEANLLKDTVNNVILYVKKILSVIPVTGRLLLPRNACRTTWIEGRNTGKCAAIKKDYAGEFCLDDFRIPDDHLEAFYTWTNKPLPDKTWFTDGKGLKNHDYILYIQAMTTASCMKSLTSETEGNVLIAYASYCRLDKNDRPVAGYINFCPTEFKKYKTDRHRLVLVTLHEIFHALGFSKDLFDKFRDASEGWLLENLPHYNYPVLRNISGSYRLLLPTVISKMEEHFGCSYAVRDIGAPPAERNGVLQSHWKSGVFVGSVMASEIQKPEYTFVDPISLAVFQDTGWYAVNFSNGDEYLWGKSEGCDFLKEITSQESYAKNDIHCPESYETGCNFWQTEVIKCAQKNISTSDVLMDCRHNSSSAFIENSVRNPDVGKCILYQSNFNTEGKCVTARCALGHAWIKLKPTDINWIKCPFGSKVDDLENGGIITCPTNEQVFCYNRQMPVYFQDLVKIEATTVTDQPRIFSYPVTQSNLYVVKDGAKNEHRTGFAVCIVTNIYYVTLMIVVSLIGENGL